MNSYLSNPPSNNKLSILEGWDEINCFPWVVSYPNTRIPFIIILISSIRHGTSSNIQNILLLLKTPLNLPSHTTHTQTPFIPSQFSLLHNQALLTHLFYWSFLLLKVISYSFLFIRRYLYASVSSINLFSLYLILLFAFFLLALFVRMGLKSFLSISSFYLWNWRIIRETKNAVETHYF